MDLLYKLIYSKIVFYFNLDVRVLNLLSYKFGVCLVFLWTLFEAALDM